MMLLFEGQGKYVVFDIDRKNKKLSLCSDKTDYHFKDADWNMLFDAGKEKEQDEITSKLNDEEFQLTVCAAMSNLGYRLGDLPSP